MAKLQSALGRRGSIKVPSEPAISEALVREIENLREEIVLNIGPVTPDFANLDQLQFSVEAPRRRRKGIGSYAKPTDIRVYRLGLEIIDLRIEAKMLLRHGDIKRSYLSNQGLKRFSDPHEPYTDNEIGGMIAYTISEDRSAWLHKITDVLDKSTPSIPNFMHRVHASADETLFCEVPYALSDGGTRRQVLVFHLVLEFDSVPSAR